MVKEIHLPGLASSRPFERASQPRLGSREVVGLEWTGRGAPGPRAKMNWCEDVVDGGIDAAADWFGRIVVADRCMFVGAVGLGSLIAVAAH